ncbi:MAG: hypothetical protein COB98_06510 [Flavobacteriaceae bacterium]|nr:MAG: hypothetical protein COB98_06510 [Flavobacteriaceae bacterium]
MKTTVYACLCKTSIACGFFKCTILKKILIEIHHYLGTFFFLLFLSWFLSGFVLMYKGFPLLKKSDKIALLKKRTLDTEAFISPGIVFKNDSIESIHSFEISYVLNRPVYRVCSNKGRVFSRYATDGAVVRVDVQLAMKIALEATGVQGDNVTVSRLDALDQWIPRTSFLKHLPVYNVMLNDVDVTRIYVSSLTGELLSLTTESDRMWAWLGAIPHWVYFKDIRVHTVFWVQLVSWLSGLGFMMAVTGIVTGLVRAKKKPKKPFRRFKNNWYNIHYYVGLIFGLFVCTWIFSGLMSMTPFSWTPSTRLSSSENNTWQGDAFLWEDFNTVRWNRFKKTVNNSSVKELYLKKFASELYVVCVEDVKKTLHCYSEKSGLPSLNDYKKVISKLSPTDVIVKSEMLTDYDHYYYSKNNTKTLPVFKITTSTDKTYYVDPLTTEMLYKCSTKNRIQRWIYHGLHSLDFNFLTSKGVLWDVVMWFLLLGGTIISLTATGLGIKFIMRKSTKFLKGLKKE